LLIDPQHFLREAELRIINRPSYLAWLHQWRDHDVAKVVTGVRRSGKSTILELFRAGLITEGVPAECIWSVNMEDPDTERRYGEGFELYKEAKRRNSGEDTHYVFIDEAQHLVELERTVSGLGLLKNIDLCLTGSNSEFLSRDLATRLTGRFVELHVLPLSFREYLTAPAPESGLSPRDQWRDYFVRGGFPYAIRLNEIMARQYLTDVLSTIVLRDIAPRQQSFNSGLFGSVMAFMFDNIGNLSSVNKISNTLTSMGRKTGRAAVDNYLAGMIASYLLYPARRYDIKGKIYLEGSAKHYLVDIGLRRAILGTSRPDTGHVLENLVFLELLRRRNTVSVGKVASAEVDFRADGPDGIVYLQVAQSVTDPNVLERELAPLKAIPDHYPRFLLVGDDPEPASHDGIHQLSVRQWLAGE
jgi:predicted AAA+ superfamily ATPase